MGQQPLVAALLLVHGIPKHFPDCAIELEIVVSGDGDVCLCRIIILPTVDTVTQTLQTVW